MKKLYTLSPTKVFDRLLRIARHRGYRGTAHELTTILVRSFGHCPRSALLRPTLQTPIAPLLPTEMLVGRRQALPHSIRVQLAWIATLERHGRARYLSVYPRETSWENAIFFRFHHPRGGSVWYRSPPRILCSYRKEHLRWQRISRDRSLSAAARRYARRKALGGRQGPVDDEGFRLAWDAFHARSKNQRPTPAEHAAWLARLLADEAEDAA
jgi:hypothetical protein